MGISSHDTLVIVLSTVFGTIGIVSIALAGFWFLRNRRRHRLFNRGLTPIGDEEIETWKVNRSAAAEADDKEAEAYGATRPSHVSKESTTSARIQYQKGAGRPSTDTATATAPRSFINGNSFSMDLPRAPEAAAFAKAPNARTGLTDEAIPGDDPFVPPLKRQPSRLQKMPPGGGGGSSSSNNAGGNTSKTPSRSSSSRTRTARSQTNPEPWHGGADQSSRAGGHSRIYSSSSIPPRLPNADDKETFAGLSPPPSRHRVEVIGQAIG